MRVKELIKQLQMLNPEREVLIGNTNNVPKKIEKVLDVYVERNKYPDVTDQDGNVIVMLL